jgi:hypothetical protein
MKKYVMAFALFFAMSYVFAQDVKGYYIGIGGQRVEVLFRKTNYSDIKRLEFRKTENDAYVPLQPEVTSEYGADGRKFIKADVELDITGGSAAAVSGGKEPVLEKRTVFLEVLLQSNASLYLYEDGSNYRYFYKVADKGNKIKQLIYKKYNYQAATVAENSFFKQQLAIDVLCPDDRNSKYANLGYNRQALIEVFQDYNRCTGFETMVAEEIKEKPTSFVFSVIAGAGSTTSRTSFPSRNIDVKANGLAFFVGGEAALKIKYSGFSIFGRAQVCKISGDGSEQHPLGSSYTVINKLKTDITEVDLSMGVRQTFAFSGTDRIFIEAAVGVGIPFGTLELEYNTFVSNGPQGEGSTLDVKPDASMFFTVGAGVCVTKKISVGIYYTPNRDFSNHYDFKNALLTGGVKYTF